MQSKEILVPYSLFGRNATTFINKITSVDGGIWIESEEMNRRCDAKSLLGVLSLGIRKGTIIKVYTDGKNPEDVFKYVEYALHSLE